MPDAGINFVWSYLIKCIFNLSCCYEIFHVSEFPQSFSVENSLNLAEDGLDWIIVRTVSQIENRNNVKIIVRDHSLSRLVHGEIIHEDAKGLITINVAKPVKILNIFPPIESFLLYGERFDARIFSNGCTAASVSPIDSRLIYFYVMMHTAPGMLINTEFSKIHFVQP